jgi:hypothetical protein
MLVPDHCHPDDIVLASRVDAFAMEVVRDEVETRLVRAS